MTDADRLIDELKYNVYRAEGVTIYHNAAGSVHRDGGPAIVWGDGTQVWYQHGLAHREDGPAVIKSDGTREWYLNGILQVVDTDRKTS